MRNFNIFVFSIQKHQVMKLRHLLIAVALIAPFLLRDYTLNNELKYISIAEWRIAHLITGEYYCEDIANLVAGGN